MKSATPKNRNSGAKKNGGSQRSADCGEQNATADVVPAHLQHLILIVGQMKAAERAGVEIGNAFEEVLNEMVDAAADHVAGAA